MRTNLPIVVLFCAALIALGACGGGGGGDEAQLRTDLEAAQEAAEAAQKAAEAAQKAAEEAERKRQEEEDARKAAEAEAAKTAEAEQRAEEAQAAAEEAARMAQEAREEAARRIEEAEQQANTAVRAPLLITELNALAATDVATGAGVGHMPGESRTFTRPLNLPATGSAPRVPGSWNSASYSGPRGNVGTDTVYLYTNIQAPGSKEFWKEHGESVVSSVSDFATNAEPSGFGTDRSLYQTSDGTPENRDNVSRGGTYDAIPAPSSVRQGAISQPPPMELCRSLATGRSPQA